MGIFDRFKKPIELEVKTHAFDNGEIDSSDYNFKSTYTEILPSIQTNIVRNINYNQLKTRWLHTKANPYGHQHTYGIVNEMFWHQPFPFMYIKDDAEDVMVAPPIKELDAVHKIWQKSKMFSLFKNSLSQGSGIGASWIVQIAPGKFRVFNPTDIDANTKFWTDPITGEIVEIWFKMKMFGMQAKSRKNTDGAASCEDRLIKAQIGINAVQYMPNPDNDSAFGRSDLLSIWTTMIYRARNHYAATIYNGKGGVNSRMLIAPDNMGAKAKLKFKKEALKGVDSELIEIYYPHQLANATNHDPSKTVQWTENKGNAPNFSAVDNLLAADSPLPPSFTQGPASGALGGKAPQEDAKRINRFFQSYVSRCQDFVKDINRVFFGIQRDDYMIVPYFREEDVSVNVLDKNKNDFENQDDMEKDSSPEEKEKEKEKNDTSTNSFWTRSASVLFKRHETRNHSTGKKEVVYKGNMLSSGFYEYEEMDFWTGEIMKIYEHLDESDLESFIDDPMSVKEFYLDLEHLQYTEVDRNSSIGKVTIIGKKKENGALLDDSEIHFKSEFDPKHKEIYLSPIYKAHIENLGKKYKGNPANSQKNISILNCSLTSYPRSHLTGMDTKATRQEE